LITPILSEPELNELLDFIELAFHSVNSQILKILIQTNALRIVADTGQ